MKRARHTINRGNRGSALLAALCFCAVLGIALASYMSVCYHTLQTSGRNNFGTYSFELAETGLEDALSALNRSNYDWSDWTLNNAASPKTATKTLAGFSFGNGATGSVQILIENYDGRQTGFNPVLNATGSATLADGTVITRKLHATAKLAPMFVNAVAATYSSAGSVNGPSSVSYQGVRFANGGSVSSIDSASVIPAGEDEAEKAVREYNEWLGSYSAIVSSGSRVTLVDTQVSGYVAAATDTPATPDSTAALMFTYSSNSRVGGPNTRSSVNIDHTRLSSSPYQPVFAIKDPSALGEALPVGNAWGSSDPLAGETVYRVSELKLSSGTFTVQGKVVLVVSGDFWISDTAQIVVGSVAAPDASLQIVIKGKSSTLRIGGLGIKNDTARAKNVAVFYGGDPDASNVSAYPTISTLTPFCGVVYAPDCNLDLLVTSDLTFTGSIIAKTVAFSGTPTIRYDLDLRRPATKFSGIETPFTVSSWQEMTP